VRRLWCVVVPFDFVLSRYNNNLGCASNAGKSDSIRPTLPNADYTTSWYNIYTINKYEAYTTGNLRYKIYTISELYLLKSINPILRKYEVYSPVFAV